MPSLELQMEAELEKIIIANPSVQPEQIGVWLEESTMTVMDYSDRESRRKSVAIKAAANRALTALGGAELIRLEKKIKLDSRY